MTEATRGHSGAGRWSSGFRPFFLMGAAYGPLALLLWLAGRLGGWSMDPAALALGHAHELLFGFATAIVCGVLLTALPGWTGGTELRGRALILLAGLWALGRLAWWGSAWLPPVLVLLLDCALLPVLCAMLWPTLAGSRQRLFMWTLPPLLALALALGNMLGLMTRVVLRHTGRPLRVPGTMRAAYALVLAAALLRLAYTVHHLGMAVLLLAALLWAAAFGLYLLCFAGVLLRPSLARASPP